MKKKDKRHSSLATTMEGMQLQFVKSIRLVSQGDDDENALRGLEIVSTSTSVDLARFFASTQRTKAQQAALNNRLVPASLEGLSDGADAFLVVRNGLGSTGMLPLGMGTSKFAGLDCQVTWFMNRRKRGPKTTTQLRLSDKSAAWIAIASDKKKKTLVYPVKGLLASRHQLALHAPYAAKGFKWKTLGVSRSGKAVLALCEVAHGNQQDSLWLWAPEATEWRELDVAGASPEFVFTADEKLVLLTSTFECSQEVASVELSLLTVDFNSNNSNRPESGALSSKVEAPCTFEPKRKVQILDESGHYIATALSSEREFLLLISDRRLVTTGEAHSPEEILAKYGNASAVSLSFVPLSQSRPDHPCVALLLECGLFCIYDLEGKRLATLDIEVDVHGGPCPSITSIEFKGDNFLVFAARDEVHILRVQEFAERGESPPSPQSSKEEVKEAEARELFLNLLESLLIQSSYGKAFEELTEKLREVLGNLVSELGPASVLPALEDMTTVLCEEEEYMAALWLLENSEELISSEKAYAEIHSPLDFLNLWQILANTVFETLDQEEDGEDHECYHKIASALWKRLAFSGLDSLVASQFPAAEDEVFAAKNQDDGRLASSILDADRAFIHGDIDSSLALYKEAGYAAITSYVACCIHAYKMSDCLDAIHSLLCASAGIEDNGTWDDNLGRPHQEMVREVCAQLGALLLAVHRFDTGADVMDTFPSPLSWTIGSETSSKGVEHSKNTRRLPLDWYELKDSAKQGPASEPGLALGLFMHSLNDAQVDQLVDASLLWDELGDWRRAVCLLKSCCDVYKSYGKVDAADYIAEKTIHFVKEKIIAKVRHSDYLSSESLIEVACLVKILLLEQRPEVLSPVINDVLEALQSSLRGALIDSLALVDLRSLRELSGNCSRLQNTLGPLFFILVLLSKPFTKLEGVSYNLGEKQSADIEVLVSGKDRGQSIDSFTMVYENFFQMFMILRSYSMLAVQWGNWQSSGDLEERKEYIKELVLCLALTLSIDPKHFVQKSQNVQKMACWILQEFVPLNVLDDDPALVSLIEKSIPKQQTTGPTKKLIENLSQNLALNLEEESLAKSADSYIEILRSDSLSCLQDLLELCSDAMAEVEKDPKLKGIQEKVYEDDGLSALQSSILGSFLLFPDIDRNLSFSDPRWPSLAQCISHPLNCGKKREEIDSDQDILAHILNLDSFPTSTESSIESIEVEPELKPDTSIVEMDKDTEGKLIALRFYFEGEVDNCVDEFVEETNSDLLVFGINLIMGGDPSSPLTETAKETLESSFSDTEIEEISVDTEENALLNKIADGVVEEAIAWAIDVALLESSHELVRALVENAIANAVSLSLAEQSSEQAEEPSSSPEVKSDATKEASSIDISHESELSRKLVKTLVENAIANAVSLSLAEPEKEEEEEEEEVRNVIGSYVDSESSHNLVKALVENAITNVVSLSLTEPEKEEEQEEQASLDEPEMEEEEEEEEVRNVIGSYVDSESSHDLVKTLVENAITNVVSLSVAEQGTQEEVEGKDNSLDELEKEQKVEEEKEVEEVRNVVKQPSHESELSRKLVKTLVENAIANAISLAMAEQEASLAEPEKEEKVEEEEEEEEEEEKEKVRNVVKPSHESESSHDLVKTLVENAIAKAILLSVAEQSTQEQEAFLDEPEKDEPEKEITEVTDKEPLSPKETEAPQQTSEKKHSKAVSGSSKLSRSMSNYEDSEFVSEPQLHPESSFDTGEGYNTMSDSGSNVRNYQSFTEVRSSLEDIHFTRNRKKFQQRDSAEGSSTNSSKNVAQRPWDQDMALFQSLGNRNRTQVAVLDSGKETKKETKKKKQRSKSRPRRKVPKLEKITAESKVVATQTDDREEDLVDSKSNDPKTDTSKEMIILELKRIKAEYLNAIKEAQEAFVSHDPSINKVLDSQVETLHDYDEVLDMAVASGIPKESGEESEVSLSSDADSELVEKESKDVNVDVESVTEKGEEGKSKVSLPSSVGLEKQQQKVKTDRRNRAAQMLKKIVSNVKSRRKSKEQVDVRKEEEKAKPDHSTASPTPVTDYRKDMPLKEQTENLLDQMEQAVELSSQTTLSHRHSSKATKGENVGGDPQEPDDEKPNMEEKAVNVDVSSSPVLQSKSGGQSEASETPSHEGRHKLQDEKESEPRPPSTPVDSAVVERKSRRKLMENDPAFDLFAHFFEIKSTDPTSRLRQKFRSSPCSRNGSISKTNFESFLLELSEFCGSGFLKEHLQYVELLFDVVLYITEKPKDRSKQLPTWEIIEEKFVQISWHYYQAIRSSETRLETLLVTIHDCVRPQQEELALSLAEEMSYDVKSKIPFIELPLVLSLLLEKVEFPARIRDLCLIHRECMQSTLISKGSFDVISLIDLMQPRSMRRKSSMDSQPSPTSVEVSYDASSLSPNQSIQKPEDIEEKTDLATTSAEPVADLEETMEETELAVTSPNAEPIAEMEENKEETGLQTTCADVKPLREPEEIQEQAGLATSPAVAEPIAELKENKGEGDLPTTSADVKPIEEPKRTIEEIDLATTSADVEPIAGPERIKEETKLVTTSADTEPIVGPEGSKEERDAESPRSDIEPKAPSPVQFDSSDQIKNNDSNASLKNDSSIEETEKSSEMSSDPDQIENDMKAQLSVKELVDKSTSEILSTLEKIKLNEIISDIKEDGDNWLKISGSKEKGSGSMVEFFDVQSISVSDFHQSAFNFQTKVNSQENGSNAKQEIQIPASNLELEAVFAEMDEAEKKAELKPKKKSRTVKRLEKETTVALSKLKKKQDARREKMKQDEVLEKKRYAEAEKKAQANILKYAKLRQQNYESILGDVQNALIEAEIAAYTLENENAELHSFLEEVESEQNKSHVDYISKLQDHLALVEAQIGGPGDD